MPLMKTTFICQIARHGFTESWYRNASSPDPNNELVFARDYATARAAIMGANASIIAIRISNVDNKRQKALTVMDNFQGNISKDANGNFIHPAAASNVALNAMATNTDFTQEKLIQLRGIWDDFESAGGAPNFNDAVFMPLFQNWGAKVVQLQYGWVHTSSLNVKPIANYVQAANGLITFTTVGDFFTIDQVNAGDNVPVRVLECVSSPNLNGQLTLFPITQTSGRTIRPIAVNPFVLGGKLQRNVKQFTAASGLRIQRIGNRQAGAPLLQSRGRGSVRVRG